MSEFTNVDIWCHIYTRSFQFNRTLQMTFPPDSRDSPSPPGKCWHSLGGSLCCPCVHIFETSKLTHAHTNMQEHLHAHTWGKCNPFLSLSMLLHIDLIHTLELVQEDSISQISHHLFMVRYLWLKLFPILCHNKWYHNEHLYSGSQWYPRLCAQNGISASSELHCLKFTLSTPPSGWINLHPCPWAWNFPLFIILSALGILRHNFFSKLMDKKMIFHFY